LTLAGVLDTREGAGGEGAGGEGEFMG